MFWIKEDWEILEVSVRIVVLYFLEFLFFVCVKIVGIMFFKCIFVFDELDFRYWNSVLFIFVFVIVIV